MKGDGLRELIVGGGIMGLGEAADALGVHNSNIKDISDMPEPSLTLQCGRIWLSADIDAFVPVYEARRRRRRAPKENQDA